MKIGFKPCGMTVTQTINKLQALGGLNTREFKGTHETKFHFYIDTSNQRICWCQGDLDVVLDPNHIPEKINKISDLPSEILQLILQRQLETGNRGDIRVFDTRPTANMLQEGFTWDHTPEGAEFWDDFFSGKYYLYYTLNYKQNETQLQRKETSIGRSKDITGSGIRCERHKPTIASGHLRDRKAIVF